MPSSRRVTHSSSSRFPIRITSYRTTDHEKLGSVPGNPQVYDRTADLRHYKTSKRTTIFQVPSTSTVTAERLSLTLPVPPSINRQYATVNGRRVLSSAGRIYKAQVGQQILVTLARSPARGFLMDQLHSGPLALSIRFFFTSAFRRDVDGGLKITQDAVCEGLGLNDNRIVETHLYKSVDEACPRIELSVCLASVSPLRSTSLEKFPPDD